MKTKQLIVSIMLLSTFAAYAQLEVPSNEQVAVVEYRKTIQAVGLSSSSAVGVDASVSSLDSLAR